MVLYYILLHIIIYFSTDFFPKFSMPPIDFRFSIVLALLSSLHVYYVNYYVHLLYNLYTIRTDKKE